MCLTTEALQLFLSIITLDVVSIEPDRITVHTPDRDVHWHAVADKWCTTAPYDETAMLVMRMNEG